MPDFAARLATLGLSQVQWQRWIKALTGRTIAQSTLSRRATSRPNAEAEALLAVIERNPNLIEELRK